MVLCLIAALLIYLHLRMVKARHAIIAVAVLLCSPAYFHISRITFGHAPGFLLLAGGYLLYTFARSRGYAPLCVAAGAIAASSAYAYPGFLIAAPVFLGCVLIAEVFMTLRLKTRWIFPIALGIGAAIAYAPVVWEAVRNPRFLERFEQKAEQVEVGSQGLMSLDRIVNAIQNYPKYFSFEYLFRVGESGLPESHFLRHSVVGVGLLPWVFLILVPLGIAGLWFSQNRLLVRAALPMVMLAFTFPIPDSLTTDFSTPPYTFASAFGLLSVPFMSALAFSTIEEWADSVSDSVSMNKERVTRACFGTLSFLLLIPATVFVFSTYQAYPWHSSGFWGWQIGMDQVTEYYEMHRAEYDELMIQWTMDRPETLIEFYAQDPDLVETVTRGLPDPASTPTPGTLYVVSGPTYERGFDPDIWKIQQIIRNPDGSIAFVLVSSLPSLVDYP